MIKLDLDQIKEILSKRYSGWDIYIEPSGKCIWVSMNDKILNFFEIQITQVEVGISRRKDSEGLDFSGHDEAFKDLDETFEYIDKNLLKDIRTNGERSFDEHTNEGCQHNRQTLLR